MTWRTESELKDGQAQAVTASQTNQRVSTEFAIRGRDRLRVDVVTSTSTTAAAQTATLQTAVAKDGSGAWIWRSDKSVSITTQAGYYAWVITLNPETTGDQPQLPLGMVGRVVVTTGVGDSCSVADVLVTENY